MQHLTEEQLVLHHYHDGESAAETEKHLASCAECRAQSETLKRVLALVDSMPIPERGESYSEQVWTRLRWKLGSQRRIHNWQLGFAAAAIAAELPAQARPDFVSVGVAALGDGKLIDEREDAAQRVELRAAFLARGEMPRRERRVTVVVVVRNQLLFCQVLHGVDLTTGSSASRNLRTARKIVCFAALT